MFHSPVCRPYGYCRRSKKEVWRPLIPLNFLKQKILAVASQQFSQRSRWYLRVSCGPIYQNVFSFCWSKVASLDVTDHRSSRRLMPVEAKGRLASARDRSTLSRLFMHLSADRTGTSGRDVFLERLVSSWCQDGIIPAFKTKWMIFSPTMTSHILTDHWHLTVDEQ